MGSFLLVVAVLFADLAVLINSNNPKEHLNEWGTYYILPNDFPDMNYNFKQAYKNYQSDSQKETKCKLGDAEFNRWFESSKDNSLYILSYYCRTKGARGYEHLKVQIKSGDIKVLDFHHALTGFGITDARDYEPTKNDEEALKIQSELLEQVKAQLKLQRNPFDASIDLCPDPGTHALNEVHSKVQNGLYYHTFPISCNYSGTDFMAYIEVVEDRDFKKLNNGKPVLAVLNFPEKYVRGKEIELPKESRASVFNVGPLRTVAFLPFVVKFFLSLG